MLGMAVLLALPATATALPGDPPVLPVEPADGAVLPVDHEGIPVSFTCPEYVIAGMAGDPFSQYGFPKDYGVSISAAPTLGPDGRLADPVVSLIGGGVPRVADPATCDARIGSGGAGAQVQDEPGTYWWQAWRACLGCDTGWEATRPRQLTLRAIASLRLPSRLKAYAGFAFRFPITVLDAPDGTTLAIERRTRVGAWKRVGTTASSSGRATPLLRLRKGTYTLRAVAQLGSDRVASNVVVVRVLAARTWQTDADDDGTYRDAKRPSVRFSVASRGRWVRGFRADIPTQCFTNGVIQPNISSVTMPPVPIAPDGRFVAIVRRGGVNVELDGRVVDGAVTKGHARTVAGSCAGSIEYTARLRAPG